MTSGNSRGRGGWLDRSSPPHVTTLVLVASGGALTLNIFLPSIPGMTAYFHTDYAMMQLVISAYLAVTAVLQLVFGPLSDRYGRRVVLLGSLVVFLIATAGTLLSTNIYVFLTFRMLQAAVAAGNVLSRATVRDMYPPNEAASKIGYITMGMSLVPMLGPILGGYLEEAYGWQASFGLVLVFGLLIFALVWADMGETNRYMSDSFRTQFRSYPELARSRRFWGYALTAAFSSGAFFAFLGGAPFVSEVVLGLQPTEVGFYFALVSIGYMAGNFLSGRFSQRVGLNRMMLAGTMMAQASVLGMLALFLAGVVTPWSFFGMIGFLAVGNGMTLPNSNAGVVSVRPHLAGSASGLGGTVMLGGGAVLSAAAGAMLTPASGAYPLIFMMLASCAAAVATAGYVIYVARTAGELGAEGFAE